MLSFWVGYLLPCFLEFYFGITVSECMNDDFWYQVRLTLIGIYLGAEYAVVLVYCPFIPRDQILWRMIVLGFTGGSASLLISIRNSIDNGYPHDAFTTMFGLGLTALGIMAIYNKTNHVIQAVESTFLVGYCVAMVLVATTPDSGICEYAAGTIYIFLKLFRIFEFQDQVAIEREMAHARASHIEGI